MLLDYFRPAGKGLVYTKFIVFVWKQNQYPEYLKNKILLNEQSDICNFTMVAC